MVLAAQQWVNETFKGKAGYTPCSEDGETGQGTLNALIEGLQSLLGITPVVPNFGATTWSKLVAHGAIGTADSTSMVTLAQSALYCKGYDGGSLSGQWDARTVAAVKKLQTDIGLAGTATTLAPKVFRALLNTDPAVLISGGTSAVRQAQQWLNVTYGSHDGFYYGSTGGFFDRVTQQNLVRGIQYELGQTDAAADGAFGPGTGSQLKAATASIVKVGSTGRWVNLFKAALIFNSYPVSFSSSFAAGDSAVVKTFQQFEAFTSSNQTGIGDYPTWAELLVSTGDPNRPGTGADMASTITSARANALVSAGYKVVGRYLTNEQVSNPLDKAIKPGELATIFGAGLRLFPIFEEGGYTLSWFSNAQGNADALRALQAAKSYGIPAGTVIYFAVDVDAQQTDIDGRIVPYFRGVQSTFAANGYQYAVGIYGSRNVCSTVSAHGLVRYSFIGGLSTGWSGNLGFPLPKNWTFNQIQGLTVGTGTGSVAIDKNVVSGRDPGISAVNTPADPKAAFFGWLDAIQSLADAWSNAHKGRDLPASTLVLQYMRFPNYGSGTSQKGYPQAIAFDVVDGITDVDFVASVDATGLVRVNGFTDPSSTHPITHDPQHLAAAANAVTFHVPELDGSVNLGDGGGWAGDMVSVLADFVKRGTPGRALEFGKTDIAAAPGAGSAYDIIDWLDDIDGYLIARQILGNTAAPVNEIIRQYYSPGGGYTTRFADFKRLRCGNSDTSLTNTALAVYKQTSNVAFNLFRAGVSEFIDKVDTSNVSDTDKQGLAQAYAYVLNQFITLG